MSEIIKNDAYNRNVSIDWEEESLLREAEQIALLNEPRCELSEEDKKLIKKEGYLCLRMTRYLQRLLCGDDLVLVNSEEIKWIVTISEHPDPENYMKPDFFLIKRGLQVDHPETGSPVLCNFRKLPENMDVSYSFGKPCD